jgi:hypothetical protein
MLFAEYSQNDELKEDNMGMTCSTQGKSEIPIEFWLESDR